jgi:hypothetical protein
MNEDNGVEESPAFTTSLITLSFWIFYILHALEMAEGSFLFSFYQF